MDSVCKRENLKNQLEEIEILQSIFCGEGELVFDNPCLLSDLESAITHGDSSQKKSSSSFEIVLNIEHNGSTASNNAMKVRVEFPTDYPSNSSAIFYATSDGLSRDSTTSLNSKIETFVSELDKGECVVLNVINFVKEEAAESFSDAPNCSVSDPLDLNLSAPNAGEYCCIVLKMHHIYSIEKRKQILSWSQENSLTGFSMPGKPGVVYAEGLKSNVDNFLKRLRALSWQKMTLQSEENLPDETSRRFSSFKEMAFDVRGKRGYHMDMGKFREFLEENDLPDLFSLLFHVK